MHKNINKLPPFINPPPPLLTNSSNRDFHLLTSNTLTKTLPPSLVTLKLFKAASVIKYTKGCVDGEHKTVLKSFPSVKPPSPPLPRTRCETLN